jgi:predicted regulator of Ras-like GTPase activity (Roadblock/LC7/MglB family)
MRPSGVGDLTAPYGYAKFPSVFPLQAQLAALKLKESLLTKSRTELMVERLRDMQVSSPDIEASAVVSVDGLPIATALPREVEEDRVSAMSAAMLSLGERIASELGRGVLSEVQIKGEKGFVILQSLGTEAVLTVLAREGAKMGLVLLDMRRAVDDLTKLV